MSELCIRQGLRIALILLVIAALSGCNLIEFVTEGRVVATGVSVTPEVIIISQWAATATASSHYGLPDWSPRRATGAPDVDSCRDDARAWASARGNGVEWLELTYNQPVQVAEIRIHQTYGRGAVSRVTLIDGEGNSHVIWEGQDMIVACPGVLAVRAEPIDLKVDTVRIDLDESRTASWNQIDAVELVGIP